MKGIGERLPPKVLDRSGFAATVIPWDTVLCNVKYKWNTDSCGSYLHVIMTLRPTALHSCPYGLILSFSLSRPASSMVGFWQLLFSYWLLSHTAIGSLITIYSICTRDQHLSIHMTSIICMHDQFIPIQIFYGTVHQWNLFPPFVSSMASLSSFKADMDSYSPQ